MKPIEPGCLALVLPSAAIGAPTNLHCLVGTEVTVIKRYYGPLSNGDFWLVDNEVCQRIMKETGATWVAVLHCSLLRIDGHQPDIDDTMQITNQLYSEQLL